MADTLNSVQIAAVFEALIAGENHPNHKRAVEMAENFIKADREERQERLRKHVAQSGIGRVWTD